MYWIKLNIIAILQKCSLEWHEIWKQNFSLLFNSYNSNFFVPPWCSCRGCKTERTDLCNRCPCTDFNNSKQITMEASPMIVTRHRSQYFIKVNFIGWYHYQSWTLPVIWTSIWSCLQKKKRKKEKKKKQGREKHVVKKGGLKDGNKTEARYMRRNFISIYHDEFERRWTDIKALSA